jgi:hypothetical protein
MYAIDNIQKFSAKHRHLTALQCGQLVYLAHICSRGDYNAIVAFLKTLDDGEKVALLNEKPHEFYEGTVLHAVLFWNTGLRAVRIFELLVEHGAEFCRDYYNQLPWEQTGENFNSDEAVEETQDYLRNIYAADVVEITE